MISSLQKAFAYPLTVNENNDCESREETYCEFFEMKSTENSCENNVWK